MIIAVDFDGTLHTGKWPNIGCIMPYAREKMQQLASDGHTLVMWTCRGGDQLTEAINWMLANDIPFHRVNDNCATQSAMYGNNSRKVYAHLYIDDKQVGGLPPWPEIYDYITELEAEYHRNRKEE